MRDATGPGRNRSDRLARGAARCPGRVDLDHRCSGPPSTATRTFWRTPVTVRTTSETGSARSRARSNSDLPEHGSTSVDHHAPGAPGDLGAPHEASRVSRHAESRRTRKSARAPTTGSATSSRSTSRPASACGFVERGPTRRVSSPLEKEPSQRRRWTAREAGRIPAAGADRFRRARTSSGRCRTSPAGPRGPSPSSAS